MLQKLFKVKFPIVRFLCSLTFMAKLLDSLKKKCNNFVDNN